MKLGFLSYLALVLPLDIISRKHFGQAFKSGLLFTFTYHLFALYWISWVHAPGTVAAVFVISLYTAFIFGIFGEIYQKYKAIGLIILPFLWIGVEYFRTLFEIAFPWVNLSYTQWAYTPLIQICEYTGDAGLSLLIVVVNILIWSAWRSRNRARTAGMIAITGLIIIVPTLYGVFVLSNTERADTKPIRISLLQGSIDLETKWDPNQLDYNFVVYDSLAAAAPESDLLVWPETAAPAYLLADHRLTGKVAQTARTVARPMLVGTLDFKRLDNGTYETFNAAIQFDPDGRHRRPYHKNKLVPFAETVPYGNYIPLLANLSLGWSDFIHGQERVIYKNDFGAYGTLICYEVIFPEMINQYVQEGVDFLVNITNDTWYGYSSGPYQHAVMAVFRAVENRIYIARAANSGFSYFVDKYGRIYNRSVLYERSIITGNIYPIEERTIFNRFGPVLGKFGLLLIVVMTIILAVIWLRRKLGL